MAKKKKRGTGKLTPTNTYLYSRVKLAAKKNFAVYP